MLFEGILLNAAFLTSVILVAVTIYFKHVYKYWSKRGIPYLEPTIPYGNSNVLIPRGLAIGTPTKIFYDEMKRRNWKVAGVYNVLEPLIVVNDPDYIKDILLRDFEYFSDRGFYENEKVDPIGGHLFAIDGLRWKKLRVKLTPTFTSGKMKIMFDDMVECSGYMLKALEKAARGHEDVDIKDTIARFTTDVIGSCAFGIKCNSFEQPDAEFRKMGVAFFEPDFLTKIQLVFIQSLPGLSKKIGVRAVPKHIGDFFLKVTEDTVNYRKKNDMRKNDFLQIMIDLKQQLEAKGDSLTIEEIAAQVFLFFVAGFDTSSTAMAFTLYELARHQDIQKKIREEVNEIYEAHGGRLTYESLSEMKYLQQVFDESVRLYPPVPTITRRCVKDYKFREENIIIEKGITCIISALGLNRDPEFYPNPDEFNPENFSEENKKTRHPYAYLPFGEGPRNCIGVRFGLMESKIGLATVIKNFKVTLSPRTKKVELSPDTFLLASVNPIYLNVEKIKQ